MEAMGVILLVALHRDGASVWLCALGPAVCMLVAAVKRGAMTGVSPSVRDVSDTSPTNTKWRSG